LNTFFLKINKIIFLNYIVNFKLILKVYWTNLNTKFLFLSLYYRWSENLWQDGFLFDFLQKKTIDLWLRKFVIYTGFLYSERFIFDLVIRIYLDNFIWPLHNIGTLEVKNVSEMLLIIVYLYLFIFLLLFSFIVLLF